MASLLFVPRGSFAEVSREVMPMSALVLLNRVFGCCFGCLFFIRAKYVSYVDAPIHVNVTYLKRISIFSHYATQRSNHMLGLSGKVC